MLSKHQAHYLNNLQKLHSSFQRSECNCFIQPKFLRHLCISQALRHSKTYKATEAKAGLTYTFYSWIMKRSLFLCVQLLWDSLSTESLFRALCTWSQRRKSHVIRTQLVKQVWKNQLEPIVWLVVQNKRWGNLTNLTNQKQSHLFW
jgi:3-methyladenine DNA glycosylase AlkC